MWSFYVPSMVCVVLACSYLLRRYAAPRVHWFAKLLVLAGWLTSVSIVALVPIDVWATLKHTQNKSIYAMWSISYWSTQLLTWVLIPLAQGFFDAGDFTFLKRLRQSVKDRIIYFSSLGIAAFFVVGILLLAGKLSFKDLLPWAMVLANTYGLVAGILLLGFGLVAIPRQLWQLSDPDASYRWALYRIGQMAEKLEDAALEMQKVATVIEATSKSMSVRDTLRPFMDKIYQQAEAEAPLKPSRAIKNQGGRVNLDELSERDLDYGADEKGLASLRRRLTRILYKINGLWSRYETAVEEATSLEDVCKRRRANSYDFLHSRSPRAFFKQFWAFSETFLRPWAQKAAALVLAATSFMLVWSEATIGTGQNPDLSPFSHMIGHGAHSEVATQLLTGLPLAYMCGCAYYSLFKLVIFSYYSMVPRATDPVSLLLNAGQVCRFAAPLAYNFMHVIRMNEKTVFAVKMGSAMDVVLLPFFGAEFNTWFPLTVVIYCLLLYLNVWDVIAGLCLPQRFRFSEEHGDNEHTERGRLLLRQEQEAKVRGQAVGSCLGLWGSVEAPGTASLARATAAQISTRPAVSAKGSLPATQGGAPPSPAWAWSAQKAQAVPEAKAPPIALSPSRPSSSRRGSQSGGRAAGTSAGGSSQLDDIFARLEPGGGGDRLGRIDDDPTPLQSLNWSEAGARGAGGGSWSKTWQ